uniref:C-X-C motif chemokine ligand 12 n=1 Tax=Corvus moneduloides TaxID=1196302 RepID=A0A8U7M576_CORMO
MPRAINHSLATPPGSPPPAPGPSIAGGAEGPPAERRGRRDEQSSAAPARVLQPPQHGPPRPGAARLRPGRHLPLGGARLKSNSKQVCIDPKLKWIQEYLEKALNKPRHRTHKKKQQKKRGPLCPSRATPLKSPGRKNGGSRCKRQAL